MTLGFPMKVDKTTSFILRNTISGWLNSVPVDGKKVIKKGSM